MNAEEQRLAESRARQKHWKRWGPYLSERAWGTVREDYSRHGSAWDYFPHDHARSRAYRWNEDGIAGISDRHQKICFSIALWNGKDPILKERLFGLTGGEGNHGEDVKEIYYYLDSTPTHSYMKFLYKYPQEEFPYTRIIEENRNRIKAEREFELIDTGLFDNNKYFDVFVEYAKADVEDILVKITVANRGDENAAVHLLLGIVLSVPGIPGQGILTILLGLIMIDIPGKRPLEARIIKRPTILAAVNKLRSRYGKEPLQVD